MVYSCIFLKDVLLSLPLETMITISSKGINNKKFTVSIDNDDVNNKGYKITIEKVKDAKQNESQLEKDITDFIKKTKLKCDDTFEYSRGYSNVVNVNSKYYTDIDTIIKMLDIIDLKKVIITINYDGAY